jgi:hypothetical protein
MITFWESEEAIRAFAGHDISVEKYYDFDKDFLIELEPCCAHYEDVRQLKPLGHFQQLTLSARF